MAGGKDIDSLKFSIVLDSQKFETDMKRVEGLAKKFEESVSHALAITNLLEAAQAKGAGAAKEKVKKQKEVVTLSREELEAKKAANTITARELSRLNALIRADKGLLDEEKKRLEVQKKQLDIQAKEELMAQRRARAEKDTGQSITLNTNKLLQQNSIMKGLLSYATQYASVFGAMAIVRNLVRITGEFEAQRAALRSILQDTAAADQIFNQLQVLAVKSPFTFKNLTSYAKQLTAFSVPVNEVFETTKKLADVSAGLGVDMGRIILAYGQVRSAEFLRGQEVRQFTEAGIPILKELADQFKEIEGHAISAREVFERISARQVPFEMVEEAFNRMTSAGGKFYEMQDVLAQTVKGKISNLQDAWEIMLSKIGDEHSGTIKGIITWITNLLSNYEKWIGLLSTVVKYIGLYSAAMAILNGVTKLANGIQAIQNGLTLIRESQISKLNILIPTNTAIEKIAIATEEEEAAVLATLNLARNAAIGILMALAAVMITVYQRQKALAEEGNKDINTINAAMSKLSVTMADFNIGVRRVEDAFKKMQSAEGDATKETRAFELSVDDLKKQFPKFIDDNVKLARTVDELGEYWAKARIEMNRYFADNAMESTRTELQSNRDERLKNLATNFTEEVKKRLPKKIREQEGDNYATMLWRFVTGEISESEVQTLISTLNRDVWQRTGKIGFNPFSGMAFLKRYSGQYGGIVGDYDRSLENFSNLLSSRNLSDTRDVYNKYLAQIIGDASLLEEFDLEVKIGQDVKDWEKEQRKKLASSDIPDKIKDVIRTAFKQFDIIENPDEFSEWQKDINKVISKYGGTALKPTDTLDDMLDKWIKEANEIDEALRKFPSKYSNPNDENYNSLISRQNMLRAISEELYGEGVKDFSGNTKAARKGAKDRQKEWEDYKREQIANIKQEFQDLKELKAAYDSFKELKFDDAAINKLLSYFFGVGVPEGGFSSAFENIATRLEGFGDNNSAKDVRNYAAGKDWKEYAKSIEEAEKEIRKFTEAVEDLEATTKTLDMEGVAGDIQRILEEANAKNRKLRIDWDQKERELEKAKAGWIAKYRIENENATVEDAEKAWQEFFDKQKAMAKASIDAQAKYNLKVSNNQIIEKADEIFKQQMSGYDLSDWSHKTLSEILAIKRAIENVQVPPEIAAMLDAETLAALEKALADLKDRTLQNTVDPEAIQKWAKYGKQLAGYITKAANAMKKLAAATGNTSLSDTAEVLSAIGQNLNAAAEGYEKSGHWIGAVVGGLLDIFNQVTEAMADSREEMERIEDTMRDIRIEAERTAFNDFLSSGTDGIFGENFVRRVRNAVDALSEMNEKLRQTSSYLMEYKKHLFLDKRMDVIKTGAQGGEIPIVTKHSVWGGDTFKTIEELAKEMKLDVYDRNGNLNPVLLQKILDTYGKLNKEAKDWLSSAIEYSEEYELAMQQVEEATKDVFDSLASDITDKFIDNFLQMGNAVDDLSDTFANLGDAILRSFLQSYILDEILNKYTKDAQSALKKYSKGEMTPEEYAAWLDGFADNIQRESETLAPAINGMIEAFKDRGLMNIDEDTANSLGSGIKGITEDTANLLASYLNAIRADVSYGRIQWERIAVAVEGQSGQYVTLNDYLVKVQADTANIADSNRRILERMEGFIGDFSMPSGYGDSLKVQIVN